MSGEQHELQQLLAFAKNMTLEAATYIIHILEHEDIQVQTKTSATDLVTQVDKEVERRIVAAIAQHYPSHTVVGEEGLSVEDPQAQYRWFIDPIDGTTNFVHQQINFCIAVSLYKGEEGLLGIVYDPMRKEMFWAAKGMGAYVNDRRLPQLKAKELKIGLIGTNLMWVRRTRKWGLEEQIFEIAKRCRGIRSLGSAALEIAYVAAGRLDGFISLHLSPWDYGAGTVLLAEVGGHITDFNGHALPLIKEKYGLLAGCPTLHEEILQLVRK